MHKGFSSLLPFAVVVLVFGLGACSANPQVQGPKETAEAFLAAMQHSDFEKAKSYCSQDGARNLELIQPMLSLAGSPFEAFTITDVSEEGEYAKVSYDDNREKGKKLNLRKDHGKWVVLWTKSDLESVDVQVDSLSGPHVEVGSESEEDNRAPAAKYKVFRDGKSATEICEEFLTALGTNDWGTAMRYGNPGTVEMLEDQYEKAILDPKKKQPKRMIVRVDENGNSAKGFYNEDGRKGEMVLQLNKDQFGNWEVNMTRADLEGE